MKHVKNKTRVILVLISMILFAPNLDLLACGVTFNILDDKGEVISKKSQYNPGDEFILEIIHKVTHRNCDVSITDTKLEGYGLKILSLTKWKSEGKNINSRKLKVKVVNTKTGKSTLSIKRNCNRGEQLASFSISVSK